MSRARWFAAGLAAALVAGAGAVTTGGFPAVIRFFSVGINATPSSTGGNLAVGNSIGVGVAAPASAGQAQVNNSLGVGVAPDGVAGDGYFNVGIGVGTAPAGFANISVLGANGHFAASVNGNATTGGSNGLVIAAGTNSSDNALTVKNQGSTSTYFNISGAGAITATNATSVPWGAAVIACTTSCSLTGMVVGQFAVINKGSSTSRASTTTLANDPDLTFTNVPNGSYHLWYSVNFSTGAGGYRIAPVLSGAYSIMGVEACAGVAQVITSYQSSGLTQCASTSGGDDAAQGNGSANGANAITIQWAQNSSNAANSTLTTGSDFVVQRIQ